MTILRTIESFGIDTSRLSRAAFAILLACAVAGATRPLAAQQDSQGAQVQDNQAPNNPPPDNAAPDNQPPDNQAPDNRDQQYNQAPDNRDPQYNQGPDNRDPQYNNQAPDNRMPNDQGPDQNMADNRPHALHAVIEIVGDAIDQDILFRDHHVGQLRTERLHRRHADGQDREKKQERGRRRRR